MDFRICGVLNCKKKAIYRVDTDVCGTLLRCKKHALEDAKDWHTKPKRILRPWLKQFELEEKRKETEYNDRHGVGYSD